jgi:type VI secretion system protein ImpL
MKKFLRIFVGRWFLSFIGALALAAIVWLLGPLLAFLEGLITRLVIVVVIFLVWLGTNLVLDYRARRAQKRMVEKLTEAKPDPAATAREAANEEVALLRERLDEALKALRGTGKQSLFAPSYLYELPWYMLIGPPGSGKTTALRNSGLNFPLSERFGRDPVRGVGGTRNCDWWLTEEAVLLDTAGRYVTQDSDRAVDERAWLGFLDLLKTFRPRQPINGAIVAIGVPEVATMPASEREAHAHAIRSRLKELRERFGLRFPVYVVFAKLDLIAGFVEFYADLDRGGREQVWGMTFPLEAAEDQQGVVSGFEVEFDALHQRITAHLLDRMNEERDPDRRSLIFGFPTQFALLKAPLAEFLHAIFAPSRFEERVLLRGIYFTSATQEGTPVDRLMAAIAQNFAVERQSLPSFSGSGRGYFLTRLLKEVIFGEASLVSTDPRHESVRLWRRRALYGGVTVIAVAALGAWGWSFFGNRELIARTDEAARQYDDAVRPFDARVVNDDNVAAILPLLDAARQLPTGYVDSQAGAPLGLTFGLYQGNKLGAGSQLAYRRALNGLLLPRLLTGVHNQLSASLGNPDLANVLLEVYLMLGQQGPLNADLIKQTVDVTWGNRPLSTTDQAGARTALLQHVDALLGGPLDPMPLDAALVGQARDVVARVPLAARAYRRLEDSPAAAALSPWRVIDHAGPAADRVLVRVSGKPLTEGIPGLYTRDGYHKVMLAQAPLAVKAINDETWVLGPRNNGPITPDQLARQVNDTLALYFQDYVRQWDALLADVRVARSTSLSQTLDQLNTLAGPTSPLKQFLIAAGAETTLIEPQQQVGAGGVAGAAAAAANAASGAANQALGALAAAGGAGQPNPAKQVDDHYKSLHDLVAGAATGQSQLDDVNKRLGDLYNALSTQASNPGSALPGAQVAASPAGSQLAQMAGRLPAPLGDIIGSIASGSSTITVGNTRRAINDLYLTTVLPLCKQALQGRYPIERASTIDISLGDFASLFKPNGVLDAFFNTNLKPYVDATRQPWRNQKVDNVDLNLSAIALLQFQRAQAIRDAFFPTGGQTPSASFVVEPLNLSNNATQVTLDVDGQTLTYAHGPVVPLAMNWPGSSGASAARLSFTAVSNKTTSPGMVVEGPWALFRLLDKGKVEGSLADQYTVSFAVGDMSASFRLRAASVRNPFQSSDLSQFRCADGL